jgi:hypothetical protein
VPTESNHPNHDQLFKELLHNFLPEFLLLVAPRNAKNLRLEHGRFLDPTTFTDFPRGDHRHLDVVYRTKTLDGEPQTVLVHVEVEAEYRSSFDERMAEYGLSLWLRFKKPVLPIALLLKGGSRSVELEEETGIGWKTVEMAVPGSWINRYRYLAFSLSAASAEVYLNRSDPLAAALAALMPYRAGSPAQHKLDCMLRIAAGRDLNAARAFQLVNIVENYLQLEGTEEMAYKNRITEGEKKEVPEMQLLFDRMLADQFTEGRKEGEELGLKQGQELGLKQGQELGLKQGQELGLKQGQELGRVEGARETLLHQLQWKFGDLPSASVARIGGCTDLRQLQAWSKEVLTAPDLRAMDLEG